MESKPVSLAGLGISEREVRCTISIGVARMAPESPLKSAEDLVRGADDAVYAAKQAGRNCVRFFSAAGEAGGNRDRVSILVVEEDPLAAKLLELMLGQRPDVTLRTMRSAAEALKSGPGPAGAPDVVLLDPRLPGADGVKLVRAIRSEPAWRGARVVVISSADSAADEKAAREAGADAFVSKTHFCANFAKWLSQIVEGWGRTRRAA
jgi:PleD family two-component response regulator